MYTVPYSPTSKDREQLTTVDKIVRKDTSHLAEYIQVVPTEDSSVMHRRSGIDKVNAGNFGKRVISETSNILGSAN